MKVAIYHRCGKDTTNLSNKIKELIEYVGKQKDWIIQDTYIDVGYSGINVDRPELNRLIKNSNDGLFDIVLVIRMHKLARQFINIQKIRKLIKVNIVTIE